MLATAQASSTGIRSSSSLSRRASGGARAVRAGGRNRRLVAAAMGLGDLIKMMMPDKLELVAEADALPGRQVEMRIDEKHYVLGNQMKAPFPDGMERIIFGNGCFWGTEKAFWRMPGVYTTAVGYAGGYTPNPTYEEACSGQTGHTEAVQVVFDPTKVALTDLLRTFWMSHDPTQEMGQGNDIGTQYRSAIYPTNAKQRELAEASMAAYQEILTKNGKGQIATEIKDDVTFYYAEAYHQQYLAKPNARPYCSAQPLGIVLPDTFIKDEADKMKLPLKYWETEAPRPGCTIRFPNEQVKLDEL